MIFIKSLLKKMTGIKYTQHKYTHNIMGKSGKLEIIQNLFVCQVIFWFGKIQYFARIPSFAEDLDDHNVPLDGFP